ncbi:AMP-binding enzyme [Aliivibrio fischeri]
MDDVVDCIAFSSPNAITGQTVAINVVTDLDDVELKLLKKKIRKYCLSKLDVYKVPTKINFTNSTNVSARFKKIRTGLS